jgi:uncharacterized oxidoreductase
MELTGNSILITGGASGIGLALAKQLVALGNTVIITGRSQTKLDAAKQIIPSVHAIQSDAGDPAAITTLYNDVVRDFPTLNVLINNAGIMRKINLQAAGSDLKGLTREIEINLNGPILMTAQFLPQLKKQRRAAIVNVSSAVAFVPLAISPVYSAAKAAIHSFTQSLRLQLKHTNITVFELAPPVTETSLFQGDLKQRDIGVKAMTVTKLVADTLDGIRHDRLEIRPGLSNMLKTMSRIAPNFIVKQLGKSVDPMLKQAGN